MASHTIIPSSVSILTTRRRIVLGKHDDGRVIGDPQGFIVVFNTYTERKTTIGELCLSLRAGIVRQDYYKV